MVFLLSRRCRVVVLVFALTSWGRGARAEPDGPVALVVNSDDPAFSWQRVQRLMAETLGTAVVATDDPAAAARRGLLTVSWRPSRHELAVTFENARGVIGRIVPAPDDVATAISAAAFLAVNLARDQVAEMLGPAVAAPPGREAARPHMVAETASAPVAVMPRPRTPSWTITLTGGVGAGWASGSGDVNVGAMAKPGLAPAGVAHLAPEVGYFVRPRVLVSISARLQFLTGTNDLHLPMEPAYAEMCGGNFVCEGPRSALAGFARATIFGADATRDLRPYASFAIGGGTLRYPMAFPSQKRCGSSGVEACVDTITTGPLFAGPGVGVRYRVAGALDLVAGLEALVGGPRFAFNVDANLGAAVSF